MQNTNEVCPFNLHNVQTFTEIYEELRAPIYDFCCTILKDKELAKDITQELFVKLWKQPQVFEHIDNIRSFLFTMARNACLNELKLKQRQQSSLKFLLTDKFAEMPDTFLSLRARWEAEIFDTLLKNIQQLPPNEQYVAHQYYFERKTFIEIAKELNVHERTVRRWNESVIEKFREVLKNLNSPIMLMLMLAVASICIIFFKK